MTFKVLLKSELDDFYEVPNLTVLIGKDNKNNPDMNMYRPLVLRPGQSYSWETEDPKHDLAPFERVTFKQAFSKIPFHGDKKNQLRESVEIETKKRKDWDSKFCPYKNHKWVTTFYNRTETIWSFLGEYIGKIEVHPGFPKRIPISPLNVHLSPWETIEIRYHHRIDSNTGQLYPRTCKWFGLKKRSAKELQELQADYDKALKKHRLIPQIIRPEMALDADLMRE